MRNRLYLNRRIKADDQPLSKINLQRSRYRIIVSGRWIAILVRLIQFFRLNHYDASNAEQSQLEDHKTTNTTSPNDSCAGAPQSFLAFPAEQPLLAFKSIAHNTPVG